MFNTDTGVMCARIKAKTNLGTIIFKISIPVDLMTPVVPGWNRE